MALPDYSSTNVPGKILNRLPNYMQQPGYNLTYSGGRPNERGQGAFRKNAPRGGRGIGNHPNIQNIFQTPPMPQPRQPAQQPVVQPMPRPAMAQPRPAARPARVPRDVSRPNVQQQYQNMAAQQMVNQPSPAPSPAPAPQAAPQPSPQAAPQATAAVSPTDYEIPGTGYAGPVISPNVTQGHPFFDPNANYGVPGQNYGAFDPNSHAYRVWATEQNPQGYYYGLMNEMGFGGFDARSQAAQSMYQDYARGYQAAKTRNNELWFPDYMKMQNPTWLIDMMSNEQLGIDNRRFQSRDRWGMRGF